MTDLIQSLTLFRTPKSAEHIFKYIEQLPKACRSSTAVVYAMTWNYLAAEVNPKVAELDKKIERLEEVAAAARCVIGAINHATDSDAIIVLDGLLEDYHNEH